MPRNRALAPFYNDVLFSLLRPLKHIQCTDNKHETFVGTPKYGLCGVQQRYLQKSIKYDLYNPFVWVSILFLNVLRPRVIVVKCSLHSRGVTDSNFRQDVIIISGKRHPTQSPLSIGILINYPFSMSSQPQMVTRLYSSTTLMLHSPPFEFDLKYLGTIKKRSASQMSNKYCTAEKYVNSKALNAYAVQGF